ncbi:MAG: electron transfer flavoprotein subunit beta/FixA family protein [Chloroflexi bacterium]|nr:electron transfer flavoprotein subunit beta/FixA family protein [Chloroflexota bacterium]
MNIIVCVKQVPDPQMPMASFKIDPATNKLVPTPGIPPVINGYDEQAVEAALRLKEANGGKITALSLGKELVSDVIKKPLSMGADELILLQDDAFEDGDDYVTAHALAAAIKKIGEYDLIICGRQASDFDSGVVGAGIGEILGLPVITIARDIKMTNGVIRVERVVPDGYEVVEASPPVVVTVSNELGQPRYPTLRGIMAAGRKQPTVWSAQDLGLDTTVSRMKLLKLYQPDKISQCEFIEGGSPAEAGVNLALKLREAKII